MASILKVDKIGKTSGSTQDTMEGLCKHWILLNGTGTIAVTDSFNNTSITDNGTGDYTITIANDMSTANFCVATGGAYDEDGTTANNRQGPGASNKTTTAFKLTTGSNTTAADDWEAPAAQTLGDLA